MSDVESVRVQLNEVEMRRSSRRQTPRTGFGHILRQGTLTGLHTLNQTAATAGYAIPGAAVVGAAISGNGIPRDAENPQASASLSGLDDGGLGMGGLGMGMSPGGGPMDAVHKQAAGGSQSAQLMLATQHMQDMNNMFNLQYLQIQQSMQRDSREFTMISNIMKTKHDTARNSLSNLK